MYSLLNSIPKNDRFYRSLIAGVVSNIELQLEHDPKAVFVAMNWIQLIQIFRSQEICSEHENIIIPQNIFNNKKPKFELTFFLWR